MKRVKMLVFSMITTVLVFALCSCGSDTVGFSMYSTDAIGATKHTVVGGDIEPSGNYTVVCTSGHGSLNVNDEVIYVFASDEYIGEEYSGLTYEETATIELQGNDELLARGFNSSDFKIEFTYNDK